MVVAGGAAPIDARQRLSVDIGPKLPEIFTDAPASATMPTGDDGVGHTLSFHQQIGNKRGALAGAGKRVAYGDRCLCLADPCHQPDAFTNCAMTLRTLMPSARAAKVSAIRCCRTGSASAFTSSMEGARRPS